MRFNTPKFSPSSKPIYNKNNKYETYSKYTVTKYSINLIAIHSEALVWLLGEEEKKLEIDSKTLPKAMPIP